MSCKNFVLGFFLLFFISSIASNAFGYKLQGFSWPNAAATMYSTGGNSNSTFDSAFVAAMRNWNGLSKFVYTSATGYVDPCADPTKYGPPYQSGYAFSATQCGAIFGSGTLAVNIAWSRGTTLLQAGTVFNSAYTWDVHSGSGANIDFKRVATHELGHAFGLDHDNTYSALMNTTYSNAIEKPQTDDINGLVAIYGSGGGTTSLSAPSLTVSISGLTVTASWSSATGATGYTLYYAPYPAATPIGSVNMGTKTSFSITLTDGAAYYVAVKAYNSSGSSGYSNIEHFTLTNSTSGSTVTDVDGNVYNTVTIGAQVWMKENLKVAKYRNGDDISTTTPSTLDISFEFSPKYQWAYNGNESNAATYGRLYTWHAVADSRGVCPTGWHVSTDAEWTTLTDYLGGESVAGGKMKEAGTTHWNSPNTGADNSSGFTALPGGFRYIDSFYYMGDFGIWWSASEANASYAWAHMLDSLDGNEYRGYDNKHVGYSVRCVKD